MGDSIKTRSQGPIHASIDSATRNELTVTQQGAGKTLEVDDVVGVVFNGEPTRMREARVEADKGDYTQALKLIDRVSPDDIDRDLVRTELAYLKIVFKVKLAISSDATNDDDTAEQNAPGAYKNANDPTNQVIELAKTNPVELAKQVGPELIQFFKDHPDSFHYYEGNELIGDLLVWLGNVEQDSGKFAAAAAFYQKLGAAPWPDFQSRANLLQARELQLQGKYADALKAYDAVIALPAQGPLAEQETTEATIGRTYCLVGTNRAQEALKILKDTIAKADDDDTALLARAYCALGNCYRALGDNQRALFAYLRVHLQYGALPEVHAEALANLEILWTGMKRPDRAREARDELVTRYPFSRWSKQSQNH